MSRTGTLHPTAGSAVTSREARLRPIGGHARFMDMTPTGTQPRRPFGRLITAMITPFQPDGALDVDGAARLAAYLVDQQRNDALVVSGTAGEAPTTTDTEKERLLRAVVEAVGDRARVIAGVGTNDTAHTVELARTAEKAGAHGLLVVTPYYSKPPQAGILRHFSTVADATGLPIMVYDIPHRTGVALATETLCRAAEHERIVAVKDAKADPVATAWLTARTELAIYCGDDALTLPWLAVGAVGVVGTSTHLIGAATREMIAAWETGDTGTALRAHHRLLPLFTGIFASPGVILTKAALNLLGLPAGPTRPPLVDATEAEIATLRADAAAAGVELPQ
jgi:4-hydroxy-tetrahydrodipicolinate synthase